MAQPGEVAQGAGQRSLEAVLGQHQLGEVGQVADFLRHLPVQVFALRVEHLECGHGAQFRREFSREFVVLGVEMGQLLEIPRLWEEFPGQGVLIEVDSAELGEVAEQCRDGSSSSLPVRSRK